MDYFLHTIALPLATLITVLAQAVGLWLWSLKQQRALKENTDLTRVCKQNAAVAADHAAEAASVAQMAAAETKEAINGRVDQMLKAAYDKGLADGQAKKGAP